MSSTTLPLAVYQTCVIENSSTTFFEFTSNGCVPFGLYDYVQGITVDKSRKRARVHKQSMANCVVHNFRHMLVNRCAQRSSHSVQMYVSYILSLIHS